MVCHIDQAYLVSTQGVLHWFLMEVARIVTSTRPPTKATEKAPAGVGTTVVGRRLVSGTCTVTHYVWSARRQAS